MSVLLKGIEIPNPGQIVLLEIDENGDVFAAYDGGRTKLAQYKAVPVPPHGRLIDADILYRVAVVRAERRGDMFDEMDNVLSPRSIKMTPTVLPADEGTTKGRRAGGSPDQAL